MTLGSFLSSAEIASGCTLILLVFFQILKSERKVSDALRVVTYLSFFITFGVAGFGKYYASNAPKRFEDIEASNPSKAITGYTEAIRLNPSSANLYYRRGRTDYHLQKYADSVRDFTRALELSPDNPEYLASRAFSSFALGNFSGAQGDITQALKSGYKSSEADMMNGMLLQRAGKIQDALKAYTAALAHPDIGSVNRCSVLINRANIFSDLKLYAEAEQDDTLAINSCDGYELESALVNRGTTKSSTGNHTGAMADWEEALRLDPNDPVIFKNRAEAYIDEGGLELALNDYSRYLQLRPDDSFTYLVRAGLYQQLGDSKRAELDRETAKKLDRTNSGRSYGGPRLVYPSFR